MKCFVFAAAIAATTASATTIHVKNSCEFQIDLYDNQGSTPMAPGATLDRYLPMGYRGMMRHGSNPQATLAEWTMEGGKAWFDISIIPTGPKSGPDYCPSLDACKAYTGGVGYNVQMQLAPRSNQNGAHCRTVTCMSDGCPDAYQYPKDDTKTHNCPYGTDFDMIFCPGGKGGQTPAPTPPPTTTAPPTTPPPTTPAPTTPAPTTPAPTTPEPTTPAPTTPAPTNATQTEAANESDVVDFNTPESTPEPTTSAPAQASAPASDAATVVGGTSDAPAVEVNVQGPGKSGGGGFVTALFVCIGVLAMVAAVAMVVVIRRKKAELDAMADKDSIIIRSTTAAL